MQGTPSPTASMEKYIYIHLYYGIISGSKLFRCLVCVSVCRRPADSNRVGWHRGLLFACFTNSLPKQRLAAPMDCVHNVAGRLQLISVCVFVFFASGQVGPVEVFVFALTVCLTSAGSMSWLVSQKCRQHTYLSQLVGSFAAFCFPRIWELPNPSPWEF